MSNTLKSANRLAQPHLAATRGTIQGAIDRDVVERRIKKAGMDVVARTELSNRHGVQFTLLGGGIVTAYNTGRCVIQGKLTSADRKALEHAFRPRQG